VRGGGMSGCFGCDPTNTAGLGIAFYRDASGRLAARCRPGRAHRGLGNIVHGGLVALFGEELAALEAGSKGQGGLVVAEMNCKYERAALVENELSAVVAESRHEGKRVYVTVDVASGGERVAVLSSSFVLISAERLRDLSGLTLDQAPACLVGARGELPVAP
jgi:acyl-coenzyme A thioesterase PaaI-like protein